MKALVYTGAETLDYRDMPDPDPREDEHLIRVSPKPKSHPNTLKSDHI